MELRIGTAGWSIPREAAAAFATSGHQLERYAARMNCVEINSSFYRPHQRSTYERWAALAPPDFRFTVKLPRAITHDGRLRRARVPIERFLDECGGLGARLAVLLVQLPPSLAFEARPVRVFFDLLTSRFDGMIACEPRHASWFTGGAERALIAAGVARVATDPARIPAAALPGGATDSFVYCRWHGSPRIYWSRYGEAWLRERAAELAALPPAVERWCIFDNTASGAALVNALEFRALTPPAERS